MPDALPFHARRDVAELEQPDVTLADVLSALDALASEMRELRAAVAPELAQRVAVLAALHDAFADANFTAVDALEAAAAAPAGAPLPRALIALIGGPVGGLRRLSRRLAKLTGKPAGGFVLMRIGADRGASLYVVQTGQ